MNKTRIKLENIIPTICGMIFQIITIILVNIAIDLNSIAYFQLETIAVKLFVLSSLLMKVSSYTWLCGLFIVIYEFTRKRWVIATLILMMAIVSGYRITIPILT